LLCCATALNSKISPNPSLPKRGKNGEALSKRGNKRGVLPKSGDKGGGIVLNL